MKSKLSALRAWPDLERVATPRQIECLDAVLEHGGARAAGDALGLSRSTVRSALRSIERKAAAAGYSPAHDMVHAVPEGYSVKGVSTMYGADGEVRAQWVKSNASADARLELMREAVAELAEPYAGIADPSPLPMVDDGDLLAVYPLSDPHLGMYAWHEETGVDWDLAKGRDTLVAAVDHLVDVAPPAASALVVNLGDFFHADDPSNRTARQGNALDVDSRWAKVLRVGIGAMRRIIDMALLKHAHVTVINAIGNHDDQSSVMLTAVLGEYYSREPRVTIDTSPMRYVYYRFGSVLLGVTHGHLAKPQALPEIMACDRASDWGETVHRHWYSGHVHHDQHKDYRGCSVETLRTLAPGDAWHHAQGYRSRRDLKCDVWHRQWGRCERYTVGIERFMP